eukprot:GEZU01027916.1.p2 GENE.GEZU01027916.1~~GEZU01027916.1.p2  ORF type:complete len:213 (+),score=40.10 GEZU01027916.1:57-641(+)
MPEDVNNTWSSLAQEARLWVDVISLCTTLLLLLGYHFLLVYFVKTRPFKTIVAVRRLTARQWVDSMMSADKNYILAVQTSRNIISVSTFLASTSVIILMGILNIALNYESLQSLATNINHAGSNHPLLIIFKTLCVMTCFVIAFLSFTVSIRYNNFATLAIATAQNNTISATKALSSRNSSSSSSSSSASFSLA